MANFLCIATSIIRENDNFFKEEILMEILKVSAKSNPNSVAGALAGVLREKEVRRYRP